MRKRPDHHLLLLLLYFQSPRRGPILNEKGGFSFLLPRRRRRSRRREEKQKVHQPISRTLLLRERRKGEENYGAAICCVLNALIEYGPPLSSTFFSVVEIRGKLRSCCCFSRLSKDAKSIFKMYCKKSPSRGKKLPLSIMFSTKEEGRTSEICASRPLATFSFALSSSNPCLIEKLLLLLLLSCFHSHLDPRTLIRTQPLIEQKNKM